MNQGYPVEIYTPLELCNSDRKVFVDLVLEGGEVARESIPGLMERAPWLAIVRNGINIQGVAALKQPNRAYRDKVFRKSMSPMAADSFELELGWVVVRPEARGKGMAGSLVERLIEQVATKAIYATSHMMNTPMHNVLQKFGFQKVGIPYLSEQRESHLQLFVRTDAEGT